MNQLLDLIQLMDDVHLFDAVNAFSTVALVLFALVQIWRTEVERRERVRAAVGAFWVEYFRAWRVSKAWTDDGVELRLEAGLLDPSEILPPDWGATLPLIGAMGAAPARLGGLAYAYAADAAYHAKLALRYSVELQDPELQQAFTSAAFDKRERLKVEIAKTLKKAGELAQLVAATLEDALAVTPAWATRITLDADQLTSTPGRDLAEKIKARAAKLPWWRRLLGRIFPSLIMISERRERVSP